MGVPAHKKASTLAEAFFQILAIDPTEHYREVVLLQGR